MGALHTTRWGPADGRPVVLLHGFTQSSVSWSAQAQALADHHRVLAVDLPGHGGSRAERMDLAQAADAVAEIGGRAAYVGYSLGGRVALRLALDHPEQVDHLVLVGATAGIDGTEERRDRRVADEERATAIERDGVAAFLQGWLAQPLFARLTPTAEDLAARRANDPAGLASSLRLCGTATMDPPWWDELAGLGRAAVPVTLVAGARDAKFAALGRRLVAGIGPTATLVEVPGAGHACHLEDPEAFHAVLGPALATPGG